jgi:deoxycytidylate deaminase
MDEASGRVENDVHTLQIRFATKSLRETDTDATSRSTSTSHGEDYPCLNCYKALASSGIKKIFYKNDYRNDPVVEDLGYGIDVKKLT